MPHQTAYNASSTDPSPQMRRKNYFVVCPSFHGATLLGKLLNSHAEILSLGDTYPTNAFDQICGCRRPVSSCEFWQAVKVDVGAHRYSDEPNMLPYYPVILSQRLSRLLYHFLPLRVLAFWVGSRKGRQFRDDYARYTSSVFTHLNRPDAYVFADGVKSISRVRMLASSGQPIDGIIHLVRSPSDFVKSYQRSAGGKLTAFVKGALIWRVFHQRAAALKREFRYLRISYDELATDTDECLREIFQFMGVEQQTLDQLRSRFCDEWHFLGNASLFSFDGTIKPRVHRINAVEKWILRALGCS